MNLAIRNIKFHKISNAISYALRQNFHTSSQLCSYFGKSAPRSQSKVLSDDSHLYEILFHNLKPKYSTQYWSLTTEHLTRILNQKDLPVALLGSWSTLVGPNIDQAVHIFYYKNGFSGVDEMISGKFSHISDFHRDTSRFVVSRSSEHLFDFTFWPEIVPKSNGWLYEMRMYTIRAGTLIEWGQHWQKGILHRDVDDQAVHGWFTQVGIIHKVYHLWTYPSMIKRRESRQKSWNAPGWDRLVLDTVPLIKNMDSIILKPAAFSPLR